MTGMKIDSIAHLTMDLHFYPDLVSLVGERLETRADMTSTGTDPRSLIRG